VTDVHFVHVHLNVLYGG